MFLLGSKSEWEQWKKQHEHKLENYSKVGNANFLGMPISFIFKSWIQM